MLYTLLSTANRMPPWKDGNYRPNAGKKPQVIGNYAAAEGSLPA
jgi:hypothetical protein